jgi:hypothetical protein
MDIVQRVSVDYEIILKRLGIKKTGLSKEINTNTFNK